MQIELGWIDAAERHVTFFGVWGVIVFIFHKYGIFLEAKRRLNDLWWDRCAQRQEPYRPVDGTNGSVIPPVPQTHHGD